MTTFDTALTRWRRGATCALASAAMIAAGSVALAGAADAAAGDTVYVSPLGNDGTACGSSLANQCQTIQYALDKAPDGGTVLAAAGTYDETVTITHPVTLHSTDGATKTVIDGTDQPSTNYGTVNVLQPGGDVTISGFSVQNPVASQNGQPFDLTVNDSSSTDTLTVTDNVLLGGGAGDADGPAGIVSSNVAATQVISGNDFSGVWQGLLLEGSSGPVTVANNNFHDLIVDAGTDDDGPFNYPAEGVYVLSDAATTASTTISDNLFHDYGGVGIKYSAGYDLGGCADRQCDGSITGSVTDNLFALTAADENSTLPAAALQLKALNAGNTLNVTVGGNTGTVVAPTLTTLEQPGAGTITVTPGTSPNTIVTDPAPTLAIGTPAAITTDEAPVAFTGTATNSTTDTFEHARYDVSITGTSGITAAQLKLQYEVDGTFMDVPLTGTASTGDSITGYFGPPAGFPFGQSVNTTNFQLSVPDVSAPAGTLTTTVALDEVSSGTGNPVLNTLATTSAQTVVTANSAPSAPNVKVSTVVNKPVDITLPGSDADGDALTYTHTDPDASDGTLSGSGADLTFTPATDFTGATSFSYTVTDDKAGSNTGTVTITVKPKAVTTLTFSISPAKPTAASTLTATAVVTSPDGPVTGGSVTVRLGKKNYTGDLVGGKAVIKTATLPVGTHAVTASYSGSDVATSATASGSVTVVKAASSLSLSASPAKPTTRTTTNKITVTVSSDVSPDGGRVGVAVGSARIYATVSGGKATLSLPKLSKGTHTYTVAYAGTTSVNGSRKAITIVVSS